MIVVDTSAFVALLRGEPEADRFLRLIATADACLVSAVTYTETSLVLAGRSGDQGAWLGLDAMIATASMQLISHDADLAAAARLAFLRFGKGRHPAALDFGDCAAYALAKSRDLPLL